MPRDFLDQLRVKLEPFEASSWFLGVSGGIDSMALYYAIKAIYPEKPLHVVHVNHQIAPISSQWYDFVHSQANFLGDSFEGVVVECSPPNEANARKQRYAAFEKVLSKKSNSLLLLAHHYDDQIETVFWRFLRGSPIQGLLGMEEGGLTQYSHYKLLRPFLSHSKLEIRQYVELHNIPFITDPSNNDLSYTRNKIRHTLLPHVSTAAIETTRNLLRYNMGALEDLLDPWLYDSSYIPLTGLSLRREGTLWTLISLWIAKKHWPHPSEPALKDFCNQVMAQKSAKMSVGRYRLCYSPQEHCIRPFSELFFTDPPKPLILNLCPSKASVSGTWGAYSWTITLPKNYEAFEVRISKLSADDRMIWNGRKCSGFTIWKELKTSPLERPFTPYFTTLHGECLGYGESTGIVIANRIDH